MSTPRRPARPAPGEELTTALTTALTTELTTAAERELRRHFDVDDPRLLHSLAVGACARALAPAVDVGERPLLVAAAFLHDLGYAADVRRTGFHPVDGARHLRAEGWPAEVCALVAHHSGARFVAWARGEGDLLDGPNGFAFEESPLTDALTAADQTIGPDGTALGVEERMRQMLVRHGAESPQAIAHARRAPYLRAAVARVEARLESGSTHRATSGGQGRPTRVPTPRREPAR